MSTKVAVLPDILANKIAAGEVVERPASVVKELVENSLDAGASKIVVEASRGGKAFIRVSDDGEGMSQADALLSLERHATSKISSEQDIYRVRTLGFRGEALPSIAAVCKLRIVTKEVETLSGTVIDVEGGKIVSVKDGGCPVGTVVEAKNLFFNIPARLKFLKSTQTEFSHIAEIVSRLALAHPQVQFQLLHNGQKVFDLAKTEDLKERMGELIGREARGQLLPFEVREGYLQVKGYISHPSFTRSRPNGIHVFINRRFVKDRLLTRAMYEAYRNIIPRERYPVALLMVEADPAAVDVNVHPTKSEVRFREPNFIYQKVLAGVRAGLSQVATPAQPAAELKSWDSMRERRWQPRERGYQGQGPPASFLAETGEEERIVSLLPRGFFSSLQIIGQAKNSFIICQSDTQLVLIDQHAAHERIVFEKLKQGFRAGKVASQFLLIPVQLDLTLKEVAAVNQNRDALSALGFELEPFGPRSVLVKSLPQIVGQVDCRPLVLDLLEELSSLGEKEKLVEAIDRVLMLIACHRVVKANLPLDREAIKFLLQELDGTDFSASCPHGRPVWKEIPFQEIERMFKR